MNPTYDFKDKVALITGASTGIGFATARHLLKQEHQLFL
jgi:NAD(P)-dependent dehydrogenase (short-subunit alcohol dehydrogenase family)